nr:chromatin accessibility complex protein 1-like [Ipomoea trifida]
MAEEVPEENGVERTCRLQIPTGRVKKIMKIDDEVKKVNSEALFLISRSTELFLEFLAEKSAEVAVEKKRKTVKLEHLRLAVKRHRPTSDFLLDSLPMPSQPSHQPSKASRSRSDDKPAPRGTRKIDAFFQKCT